MEYIKYNGQGIEIFFYNKSINKKCSMTWFLNNQCNKRLATYKGYTLSVKKKLGINVKTPIYVNNNTLFLPTHSIRRTECILINYFSINAIYNDFEKTVIIFKSGKRLVLNVKISIIKKQIKNAVKIIRYLKTSSKEKQYMI